MTCSSTCRTSLTAPIFCFFFLMIRRPPRSTLDRSSAASDVYKRQLVRAGPVAHQGSAHQHRDRRYHAGARRRSGSVPGSESQAGVVMSDDENKLIAERRAKLEKLRTTSAGGVAFPNDFRRDALADQLLTAYGDRPPEWFDKNTIRVKVGGRRLAKRVMGKASFAKIADRTGQIQVFAQGESLGASYDDFKGWDVGDLIGAEGVLFKT